ncbi:MAG: neutral zinc metallopeptidase [Burkholderiales bacterium]
MRWDGQRESDNVDDVRGESGGGRGPVLFGGGRGIGLGTVAVALIAGWLFGINPLTLLNMLSGGGEVPTQVRQEEPAAPRQQGAEDAQMKFLRVVAADTEEVWAKVLPAAGVQYQDPRIVVFRGSYPTACGQGEAAMGPFYCPGDHKVYIDLGFYDTLRERLGAPGDFAQAYVVAHEVGHHVQNLLGTSAKVDAMRERLNTARMNALSVRVELQADCYAGIWAYHSQRSKGWLEQGDLEEALNAASKIGDDTLQRQSQGRVVPESFTHGSSAQRMRWFKRGADNGRLQDCDTFRAETL